MRVAAGERAGEQAGEQAGDTASRGAGEFAAAPGPAHAERARLAPQRTSGFRGRGFGGNGVREPGRLVRRALFGLIVGIAGLALTGCGSEMAADLGRTADNQGYVTSTTDPDATTTTWVPEVKGVVIDGVPDTNEDLADITTATFSNPTVVDNPWLPLRPGQRWVFEGITVEDGEEIPHRVEFHVTDLTKMIDGIESIVMWDLDFSEGVLVEAELAFFAQDDAGNVWHMGEYPEEYEGGRIIDNPSWFAGLEGALAGYQMLANPQPGTPSYSQGWGPAVDWTDRGQVDALGVEVCTLDQCYQDALVIAEWALDERAFGVQLKSYARDVGNIKVGIRGIDATQEELNLVAFETMDEATMNAVRRSALELEASGYENSEVYGLTEPLIQPAG